MRQAPARVQLGIDRVLSGDVSLPTASSIGMLTHSPAVTGTDPSLCSYVALYEAGVPVRRLFSPEHGLLAVAADGASVADGMDATTGLPIVSLYGEVLEPTAESLEGLDLILIDLQDVGSRFYTYMWAMWHTLVAAGRANVPCLILDRPNPTGGVLEHCEGPVLAPECSTYLGRYRIPVRHGLTLGEMARLWVVEKAIEVSVEVVEMSCWDRSMMWHQTGLQWVPTSPAMQNQESTLVYPGLCFFEATNVSVGRGTEASFESVLSTWIKAEPLREAILEVWGVELDVEVMKLGDVQGVRFRVLNEAEFRPVCFGLWLLGEIKRCSPEFSWMEYPTNAHPSGQDHLVRLLGRADAVELIEKAGALAGEERRLFLRESTACESWGDRISNCLIYS